MTCAQNEFPHSTVVTRSRKALGTTVGAGGSWASTLAAIPGGVGPRPSFLLASFGMRSAAVAWTSSATLLEISMQSKFISFMGSSCSECSNMDAAGVDGADVNTAAIFVLP